MFALMITLCLSDSFCYDNAPESYTTVTECWTEYNYLVDTKQIDEKSISCVYVPEE